MFFDAASGQEWRSFDYRGQAALGLTPDGRTLVIDGHVWDVATGLEHLRLQSAKPQAVAFTPDGRTLLGLCEGEKGVLELRAWEADGPDAASP